MFEQHEREGLVWLTSSMLDAPGLIHCFSTRRGGVSTGPQAALNLRLRGDSRENVLENYRILGASVGFSPESTVFTRQMHTDIVRPVTAAERGMGLFRPISTDCDALITRDPGITLTVFSADCCPVLLHDRGTGAVAAVHSGWRGTALGIVKKTVDAMVANYGTDPSRIRAAIGPCIGLCCFETDADVPNAMLAALGSRATPAITKTGPKYHVDLKMLNLIWLHLAGVPDSQIDVCSLCTFCRSDLFFSHRRDGERRGSLAAFIGIAEPEEGGR